MSIVDASRTPIVLFPLACAAALLMGSGGTGGTDPGPEGDGDPTPGLASFDGSLVNDALASSLAEGTLVDWQRCRIDDEFVDDCIVLVEAQADGALTSTELTANACASSMALCQSGYRASARETIRVSDVDLSSGLTVTMDLLTQVNRRVRSGSAVTWTATTLTQGNVEVSTWSSGHSWEAWIYDGDGVLADHSGESAIAAGGSAACAELADTAGSGVSTSAAFVISSVAGVAIAHSMSTPYPMDDGLVIPASIINGSLSIAAWYGVGLGVEAATWLACESAVALWGDDVLEFIYGLFTDGDALDAFYDAEPGCPFGGTATATWEIYSCGTTTTSSWDEDTGTLTVTYSDGICYDVTWTCE